jgi:hypothetical protein
MREINQGYGFVSILLMLFVFTASCASIPELKVSYQLPPASDELNGKKVLLKIQDARTSKEVLSGGAKKELWDFSGNFSLSVAQHRKVGVQAGVYRVVGMMREGFRRRLENEGLVAVFQESGDVPQLLIVLNEFVLDRAGRDWAFKMGYEARLIRKGKVFSKENISGEGSRYNFSGRGAAETLLGDIFTDSMNRLDIKKLFQGAGLL